MTIVGRISPGELARPKKVIKFVLSITPGWGIVQNLYGDTGAFAEKRKFDKVRHSFVLWQTRSGSMRARTTLCHDLNSDSACRTQSLPTVIWPSLDRWGAAPLHPAQVPRLTLGVSRDRR